ncbi:hypothetical protein EU537_08280 [Candidatus Thorarchaeota archaeon]|nr:MAG: hypothetical protein EU537_08280 [Candidatus Thorarchaeota archaeon]
MERRTLSEKLKRFVKVIDGKLDATCDGCGKVMKPGGYYQLEVDGDVKNFHSEECMEKWESENLPAT